ncbi:MAG: deoxyribose-phosphate aldolase [Micromonosporaceae bacterium]|nr:deoxyribose-phosphate aldolase [Micromonosporaceae bacterium]
MIDHSLLHPTLTTTQVEEGCALAARYQVASVCARPCDVPRAARLLAGTGVEVGTVVGFPHGSTTTAVKVAEANVAVDQGARELDMVLAIGWLRSGDLPAVEADIRAVVEAVPGLVVKVILENAYLTDEEKIAGCQAVERAGAAFAKTSTGFAPSGATVADVRLMRATLGQGVQVKAAGGIRTLDQLLELHAAGATRFGATATEAIISELARRS